MPQPATHYLVTRRSIPTEHQSSWWDEYKPYFGLGSSAPDLFYFPLMPFLNNVSEDYSWENIADPMHSSKSYDMFCTLLDIAKANKASFESIAKKQFAFSFGYYCHVITDCIFHPYVYRSTGDHWSTKDRKNEIGHKLQEYYIDTGIFNKYYLKTNASRMQWSCSEKGSALLEFDIASLFHEAMQINYTDSYPNKCSIEQPDHPIQQAYLALIQSIPILFEDTKLMLFGKREIFTLRDIGTHGQDKFFVSPYPNCGSLINYSPKDLFDFASVACRKLFTIALAYWNSNSTNAKLFFENNPSHYLNSGNWNLDTGLPCRYNNYTIMRNENHEHYAFCIPELKQVYSILQSEYAADSF